jgi:hypothetical protein
MVDTRHPFNASKSHAIERHLDAEFFDIITVAPGFWVLPFIGDDSFGIDSFVCPVDVRF